jgi:uncharacterized protein YbjT (DUF2867 family)
MAVLAGASGLVGSLLLPRLLAAPEYARVIALTRRPLGVSAAHLVERPAQFDALDAVMSEAVPVGTVFDVFCCLGTTIAAAGSQAAFAAVDRDAVVALGRWAAAQGARRMLVVTAVGADPASRVFYNRIKGETEAALRALPLAALTVLRPSLLDGARRQFRPAESIALAVSRPLRRWLPAGMRPVRAADVAATLLAAARSDSPSAVIASAQMHGAAVRDRSA